MVETKIVYAVFEYEYEEDEGMLLKIFESKKEATDFAYEESRNNEFSTYDIKHVEFKPREIW